MYDVYRTDSFVADLKEHRKNRQFLDEPDKKIQRLKAEPHNIGKYLSGSLKGKKSVRIAKISGLFLKWATRTKEYILEAMDNRSHI